MELLVELQKRVPDGWFLRRLLPATLFVMVAIVGGGQLGQRHWNDLGLARESIAGGLRLSGGLSADGVASLVLVAVVILAAAFAVPLAAGAIGALASGAWPWWLIPPARRVTAWRVRRWAHPDEIGRRSVRARAAGRHFRADRLDARRARTQHAMPGSPTWSGDRLRATEEHVARAGGTDIASEWTKVLLSADDIPRTALSDTRASYDAACEALTWSAAFTILGAWWWPAAPVGVLLWLTGWLSLRRAVESLCRTTEAVFALHATDPPPPPTP